VGRSRLGGENHFVPGFVQYTVVIVATGILLMAGHFVEVMVWAITYGLVGIAPPRVELIYLAFGNYTDARLYRPGRAGGMAALTADDGAERQLIGWSTAVIIEILRRGGQTATS
jgi:hypothetical protein